MDYIFTTYLLDEVPATTLVLNRPSSIRDANEKMIALAWPELCPPTLVTREIQRAMEWAEASGQPVVIKPWDGNGGRGVLVTRFGDANLRSMLEVLTDEERRYILMQHYIPEIVEGDKRIILIDGEPLGWMLRVPQPGDHRGNMHVGARVEPCELSTRDREICAAIGPYLKEKGLVFTGIDTIGPYLTEINVTSPTGIQEINQLMNLQLENVLGDAVERRWKALQEST
jgi:glutathione synthase